MGYFMIFHIGLVCWTLFLNPICKLYAGKFNLADCNADNIHSLPLIFGSCHFILKTIK